MQTVAHLNFFPHPFQIQNIVRDPRWGRNIESAGEVSVFFVSCACTCAPSHRSPPSTLSPCALPPPPQDPFVSGQYAAHFVQGFEHARETPYPLQASTCCKHFVANELDQSNGTDRYVRWCSQGRLKAHFARGDALARPLCPSHRHNLHHKRHSNAPPHAHPHSTNADTTLTCLSPSRTWWTLISHPFKLAWRRGRRPALVSWSRPRALTTLILTARRACNAQAHPAHTFFRTPPSPPYLFFFQCARTMP